MTGKRFSVHEYQILLEKILKEEIMCGEDDASTKFFKAIEFQLLLEKHTLKEQKIENPVSVNVWLDIENDVIFTITKERRQVLTLILEDMKFKMSQGIYRP